MAVLFMLLGASRKQELLVIEMANVIVQTDKPILLPNKTLNGCVHQIFACLQKSETRKNVFYFTSKALFVLEIIKC